MQKRLETENIWKLLTEFSLPAVTGMVVHSCYNIIARIYIGNNSDVGINCLAALSVAFPIILVMMAFASIGAIGGASLYSIKLGEKDTVTAEKVLGNSILISIVTAVLCSLIVGVFMPQMLFFFGASESTLPYAAEYLAIMLIGSVFGALSFTINAFVRADGSPSVAMYTMIIGAVSYIVVAPVLIYVFHWGMTGAALASVLGQTLTMSWVIAYFRSGKSSVKLSFKTVSFDMNVMKKVVSIGMPSFALQTINGLVMVIMNKSLYFYGGDLALSAMGIVQAVQTIIIMPIIGVSQGAQPIIGYNFGAGKNDRVIETFKKASIAATVIVLLCYCFVALFPHNVLSMFNGKKELLDLGKRCMQVWLLAMPIVGFQIMGSCYFQSVGKVFPALVITMTRQLIFLIPAMLILPRFFGFDGILYSAPLSDFLSTLTTAVWLYFDMRNGLTPAGGLETAAMS